MEDTPRAFAGAGATRRSGRFLQKTKLPALAEKAFHRLGVHCRVTCKILADGANLLGFSLFCSGGVIKCVLGIPHWLRLFFLLPVYGVVRCRIKGTACDKHDTNSYSQILHSSPFVLPHPGAAYPIRDWRAMHDTDRASGLGDPAPKAESRIKQLDTRETRLDQDRFVLLGRKNVGFRVDSPLHVRSLFSIKPGRDRKGGVAR